MWEARPEWEGCVSNFECQLYSVLNMPLLQWGHIDEGGQWCHYCPTEDYWAYARRTWAFCFVNTASGFVHFFQGYDLHPNLFVLLDASTANLHSASSTHDVLNGFMVTSKHLITALEKSDWLDCLLIFALFFVLVVLFILKQRLMDCSLWITFW